MLDVIAIVILAMIVFVVAAMVVLGLALLAGALFGVPLALFIRFIRG